MDEILLGLEPHESALVQDTPSLLEVLEHATEDAKVAVLGLLFVDYAQGSNAT